MNEYQPAILRNKDMAVYGCLNEEFLPYFRAVDYVGTSVKEKVVLRFVQHCRNEKRAIVKEKHRLVVFKEFTTDRVDKTKFKSPAEEALAYELLFGRFFRTFQLKFSQCKPGVGSEDCNLRLLEKLEGDTYTKEILICDTLQNPTFVDDPATHDEYQTE